MESEDRTQRAKRFAKIWWQSRADGKKSQEYMALGLGVSKKTIQNWEKGTSSPSFFQSTEWFHLLAINPLPYYLAFLYPDQLSTLCPSTQDEKVEEALLALVKQSMPQEKRQLLYLMAGHHGSSWYSLLQMFTAHCHTTMRSRVAAARLILENFEMEKETGDLVSPLNVMPDTQMLQKAVMQGKQAVLNKENAYASTDPIDKVKK